MILHAGVKFVPAPGKPRASGDDPQGQAPQREPAG